MKFIFLGFIFFWVALSCSEKIMDNPTAPSQNNVPNLKSANIYYVSPNGSDSNNGSSTTPFKTIQKAADAANGGDMVILKDGIYTTSADYFLSMSKSGNSSAYITFQAEHKWGAVLDGQESSDGSSGTSYAVILTGGASYIKFVDLEFRNFLFCPFIFNDHINPSSNIIIKGNKIHDMGRYPHTDAGRGGGGMFFGPGTHHISVDQNLFYNIGRTANSDRLLNQDHVLYTGSYSTGESPAHHMSITYNIIYGVSGDALELRSTDDFVANNVIAWSNENSYGGSCFIQTIDALNETFVNNIFYQPPSANKYAILNYGSAATFTVENNIVYGGSMWVFHNSDNTTAMKGNNYGQSDCEYPEINPLFVSAIRANMPNEDFSLQSTSPAINKGIGVGLTSDFSNNSIVGLPDIGAMEYGGQSSGGGTTTTSYYNTQVSKTAIKNDCGSGYTGSTVTYTVAAKTYSSTASQADADSKASADLNNNAQTYANTNGTCTTIPVYYNTQISATATKNNCGTGYTGSTVTYTVTAKKYSSTISQADADSKATADLNSNTQNYANTNGTCTAMTVYYNTQMSATAVKNDCGKGYQGSTVKYTVSAGKYSSTISLADADSKALDDLNANKQTYANQNGTCERINWWNREKLKWWNRN